MPNVIVDFDGCTGCGSCIEVCPTETFGGPENGKVLIIAPEDCIGCRACESGCPEGVITIED